MQLGRQRSPKYQTGKHTRPYLRVANVFDGRIDTSDVLTMDFHEADVVQYELKPGDILLNEGQSPEYLGRNAIYRGEVPGACFQNTLIRFQPDSRLTSPEFAHALFQHYMYSGQFMPQSRQTTNIAHLGAGRFASMHFSLPPIEEQTRILAAVDEVLPRVDAGIVELNTSRRRLAAYRAAVLKAACEGRLVPTEAELARAEGREFENSDVWLQQHGIEPEETPTSAEIPEGWARVRLVMVAEPRLGLVDPRDFPSAIHLAPDNVEANTGRLLSCRTIAEDGMTSPKHRFSAGNIVYSKIRPHLSKVALPPFEGLCSADMYPLEVSADAGYVHAAMLTEDFLRQAVGFQGRSVLPKINLDGLAQLWISLPPLPEQHRIVAEVDRRLSVVEQLEAAIARSLQRAARLRQAILKQAFEGKLVPQNPDDEPAGELLKRIQKKRGERDQSPIAPRPRRGKAEASGK